MLNVFAAVAAEVTHFLSVDINDVACTPACGAFPDEIGMRRLSCLYSLIDALDFFRGKFERHTVVPQRRARHERLPARCVIAKFVSQKIHVIRLDSLFTQRRQDFAESNFFRKGVGD